MARSNQKDSWPQRRSAAGAASAFRQMARTGNHEGENLMTAPQTTTTAQSSLWREGLHIARYYLGNRWVLVALGAVVLVAGIALNWGWLVAAGIAPILLSTLPCLIMCGLGLCMLCRSGEKQTTARDAADAATSSAALEVAKTDSPSTGAATCRHEQISEREAPQVKRLQPIDERRNPHA